MLLAYLPRNLSFNSTLTSLGLNVSPDYDQPPSQIKNNISLTSLTINDKDISLSFLQQNFIRKELKAQIKQESKKTNDEMEIVLNSLKKIIEIQAKTNQKLNSIQQEDVNNYSSKINQQISDDDFNELIKYEKDENIEGFIAAYQVKHPSLSTEDVISISVIKSIKEYNKNNLIGILLHTVDDLGLKPLVKLDINGVNIILSAIQNGIGINKLSSYISHVVLEDNTTAKFDMDRNVMNEFARAIHEMTFDSNLHPQTVIDELIKPIYSEQACAQLTKLIGQDWLDNYYL